MSIESIAFIRKDGNTVSINRANGLPYLDDKDLMSFLNKQGIMSGKNIGITLNSDGNVIVDFRSQKEK